MTQEGKAISPTRHGEACAQHQWEIPARYNIAVDIGDKHPREKLAMVYERFDGHQAEITSGELQNLSGQAAHALVAAGAGRGDRVAVVLPPSPGAAAILVGTWKLGALLLSMSVPYGDDGIHRLTDSGATVIVTDRANAPRLAATRSKWRVKAGRNGGDYRLSRRAGRLPCHRGSAHRGPTTPRRPKVLDAWSQRSTCDVPG